MARTLSAPLAACLDIGGSKALIGIIDPKGTILASQRFPVLGMNPPDLVEMLAGRLRALAEEARLDWNRLVGLGYSTAGMLDVESGIIFASPNQGDWHDMPFGPMLRRATGLSVWIEMDANAAALGEAWLGAGAGTEHLIYVVVGTGIGAGILVRGEVIRGWRGTAGEFGHMIIDPNGPLCNCGNFGCLESLAAGPAIALRTAAALQRGNASLLAEQAAAGPLTAEMVFQAARRGDRVACDVIQQTVDYLAVGLTNLVHLLNPQVIVLGGGVAVGGSDLLLEPLQQAVITRCGRWIDRQGTRIAISALGDNAGLLGAGWLVWKNYGNRSP